MFNWHCYPWNSKIRISNKTFANFIIKESCKIHGITQPLDDKMSTIQVVYGKCKLKNLLKPLFWPIQNFTYFLPFSKHSWGCVP